MAPSYMLLTDLRADAPTLRRFGCWGLERPEISTKKNCCWVLTFIDENVITVVLSFFFFIYASLNTSSGNIPPRDPSTLQADSMWCEATPNSGYLIRPSPYVSMKGPSWRSWQHMLRTYQLSFSVSTIQPIAWASKYCKATPRYLTPFCY